MPLLAIFYRALTALLGTFALFLYYEVYYHRHYENKQIPLTLGYSLLFLTIVYKVSSFILGAMAFLLLFPEIGETGRRAAVIAGVLGMWGTAIFLQIGQNGVRRAIGVKTYPIRWIRPIGRTKK